MPATIMAPIKPNSPAEAPTESDGVDHKVSRSAEDLLHLRSEIEDDPRVHQNVQDAAVEVPGGDQPPPLAREDRTGFLGSELVKGLPVDVRDQTFGSASHRVQSAGRIKAEVHQQQHHGGESGTGDQASEGIRAFPPFNGGGTQSHVAVGANFIVNSDEGPAIRAHPALFHCPHCTRDLRFSRPLLQFEIPHEAPRPSAKHL
jgi:hypothetical protein